jgi:hypothetical protein
MSSLLPRPTTSCSPFSLCASSGITETKRNGMTERKRSGMTERAISCRRRKGRESLGETETRAKGSLSLALSRSNATLPLSIGGK